MSVATVLAVRLADRSGIVLRGKERTSWLNGLVTCDLAKLAPAAGAYGLVVEKKGRIQADFLLLQGEETFALAVPLELRDALVATLDHYLVMEDVELEPQDLAFWHLHGPAAAGLVAELTPPPAFQGSLDLLGSGGAAVAVPVSEAEAFGARLAEAVARAGGTTADDAAWEAVRIEHGLPRFGVEFDATLYPQEAALERLAVSFDKGCYLGQEVVYMLENRGHVKRKLVPLDIDGETAPAKGDPITTPEGTAIGEVRSAVVGPASGKPVAIGMVKWAQTKPGTELRIGERVARVRASDRA